MEAVCDTEVRPLPQQSTAGRYKPELRIAVVSFFFHCGGLVFLIGFLCIIPLAVLEFTL